MAELKSFVSLHGWANAAICSSSLGGSGVSCGTRSCDTVRCVAHVVTSQHSHSQWTESRPRHQFFIAWFFLLFASWKLFDFVFFRWDQRLYVVVVCLFQWICPAAKEIEGIEPLSASSCRFLQISWLFAGDTVSEWWHRCWLCGIIFIKKKLKLTSIQGKIIYYFILFEKQIIKQDSSYISPQAIALFLQIGEIKGTTKWREMLKRANTKRRK